MKLTRWTDATGYERATLLRDGDGDELREAGLPVGPPDIHKLDWEALVRDLHNELMRRGLFNWQDVQRSQNGLTAAVRKIIVKPLIALYRERPEEDQ